MTDDIKSLAPWLLQPGSTAKPRARNGTRSSMRLTGPKSGGRASIPRPSPTILKPRELLALGPRARC